MLRLICLCFLKSTVFIFRFVCIILNLACWLVWLRRVVIFLFRQFCSCLNRIISNNPMRLLGNYCCFCNLSLLFYECRRFPTLTSLCRWFEILIKYFLWFFNLSCLNLLLPLSFGFSLPAIWSFSFLIILFAFLISKLLLFGWSSIVVDLLTIFSFWMLRSLDPLLFWVRLPFFFFFIELLGLNITPLYTDFLTFYQVDLVASALNQVFFPCKIRKAFHCLLFVLDNECNSMASIKRFSWTLKLESRVLSVVVKQNWGNLIIKVTWTKKHELTFFCLIALIFEQLQLKLMPFRSHLFLS